MSRGQATEAARPAWDLSEQFANFTRDIRRLRAAGHRISDAESYDLFMQAMATHERTMQLQRLLTQA